MIIAIIIAISIIGLIVCAYVIGYSQGRIDELKNKADKFDTKNWWERR